MPRYRARVEVWLKRDLVDAEGRTVIEALRSLGYKVSDARVGKVYSIEVEAESEEGALKVLDEMCRRLLANPVKDTYSVVLEERRE
ncbi:MAG: phosphoribosylformylglycinamidine synthase subunit PurS [Fervidicoccaceae archaeon]